MLASISYDRSAWDDRFNQPTIAKLKAGLGEPAGTLFEALRSNLLGLDGVSEGFAWHGACWRWTIEYRTKHSDDPLAVVVPSPSDLQLAVPLDPDFIRSLPMRRMKRAVRDGVDLAQEPFDTHWGVWSIQAEGLLDDLVDLIELKLTHQAKRAG